jgi:CDP-glycerol glycerophosphotransferase
LKSIARQTLRDLEVILVDDGSVDSSSRIAHMFAATDPRFRVVTTQDNSGPGPARNAGVAHAVGEYVAFADSDDLVARYAYERMIETLTATGSDFAAGDVRRFDADRVWESWSHLGPFAERRLSTHVSQFHLLALDRMIWNKVYRRDFWDRRGFAFSDMLYEDYPVTIQTHVDAAAVDVLRAPVYYWRARDAGDESITQNKWNLSNLEDRVRSAVMVLDFLAANLPVVRPLVVKHLLHIDLNTVVRGVTEVDPADADRVLDLADKLISRIDQATLDQLPALERLQNFLVQRRSIDRLHELAQLRRARSSVRAFPADGQPHRSYVFDLPWRSDPELAVPQSIYRVPTAAMALQTTFDGVTWRGSRLVLSGTARIRHLAMSSKSSVRVWLVNRRGELKECDVSRHMVSTADGDDHGGFAAEIDVRELGRARHWLGQDWMWRVEVGTEGETRSGPLRSPASRSGPLAVYHRLEPHAWAQPLTLPSGVLAVRIKIVRAVLSEVIARDDCVLLCGYCLAVHPDQDVQVVVSRDRVTSLRLHTISVPRADGRHTFTSSVDLSAILASAEPDDPVSDSTSWRVMLEVDGRRRPLHVDQGCLDLRYVMRGRTIEFTRTPAGTHLIREGPALLRARVEVPRPCPPFTVAQPAP